MNQPGTWPHQENIEGSSDHSEMAILEGPTGPQEVSFSKDRTPYQVQRIEEAKEELETEKTILQLKQWAEVKRKTVINIILLSASFGGGFGLLLSGIIFTNGFLSWMGAICMALGLVHLITSS